MFASSVAFVDLETTGMRAPVDRVTEVGIVRVDCDEAGDVRRVDEWSSLVDPGVPIPPAIQAMTGISDAMVRAAPSFRAVAGEVEERLRDCLFVAHNARFDYGFLKHEFGRLARPFSARVLCTVKLSRRLYPDAQGHSLDALIARHALDVVDRHRALGDARALHALATVLYRSLGRDAVDAAVKRLLRMPSLPPQLAPDALESLPDSPGVYLFYGLNALPLYIGKSRNVRERVGAHFSSDWRSETDLRLSAEIQRIDCVPTAGELGALLREATLVKSMMPAHNRALRRKADAGILLWELDREAPQFVPSAAIEPSMLAHGFGPYASRRAARERMRALADEHALCWTRLGLERRVGPCFARQLRRCRGTCDGAEPVLLHDLRWRQALAADAIPRWPFAGPALIREHDTANGRTDVHVVEHWHWRGTARDESELADLVAAPSRPAFDVDVTRLLLRTWAKTPQAFVAAPATLAVAD